MNSDRIIRVEEALERFKTLISQYISTLSVDEKIIARNKQINYAIEDKDYLLALGYSKEVFELLFNKIKNNHC